MKIALIASTGAIMSNLTKILAKDSHDLILIDRNITKSEENKKELLKINPNINIDLITLDLLDISKVKEVTNKLISMDIDYLILGAGIYKEKIFINDLGYNNLFQVNFISQYYIAKTLLDSKKTLKCIVVSSVAYKYKKINESDIPFNNEHKISNIYGNSKKFLTYSLMEEYKDESRIIITHPGITYSKISNHFPKIIRLFIRLFMPKAYKASLNIYYGLTHNTSYLYWIGPRLFNVYGKPKISKMKISDIELKRIAKISEDIYEKING